MGIGFVIVVRDNSKEETLKILSKYPEIPAYEIGQITEGPCDVQLNK